MISSASFRQGEIAYRTAGSGRCVVLLHGFLESSEVWESSIQALSTRYRVVAIDLPGHGQSPCFGYVHSMELMAGAVKAVLDYLGLRRYVMAGHSMGGYVALAFAELFPDNLIGLALVHSTAAADSLQKQKDRELAIQAIKKNPQIYVRAAIPRLFFTNRIQEFTQPLEHLTRIAGDCSRQGMIAALEGMKTRKNREMLLSYAGYPVMFVAGTHDPVLPYEVLSQQFALPKKPSVVTLKESAHMGFIEEQRKFLSAIKHFVARCHREVRRESAEE